MKKIYNFCFLLLILLSYTLSWADKPVKITVDWEDLSYENMVEVYDPANNLILTICNTNIPDPDTPVSQCYTNSGTELIFTATYDLGCLQNGSYSIRLFNINNMAWNNGTNAEGDDVISIVKVDVDGVILINDDGNNANATGTGSAIIPFSVSGGGSSCSPGQVPDTDNDGVIDRIDLDDDNDGIPDADEGLGINNFDCTIPALNFAGNNNTAESGTAGDVGAIYRFENAIFGEPYDVLVEITEIRNASLITIDDDTVDNENYLQTRLEFRGNETPADCGSCDYPGITFKFTIVDTGTSDPAATLFRIGGTTWDVDGPAERRESVRYYGPSAYGTDNPTTVEVTDVNGDNSVIEMTAGGILEGPGFSTLPQLRAYFQFLSNTFTLRMQNVRTTYTASNTREYGMSFTQCDVLDFQSASIIIVNGRNNDGDLYDNHVDLDSDDDGIPDNVEAQSTNSYIVPSNLYDPLSGLDLNYPTGLTNYQDTDGDKIFDFLDPDSDNDGKPDITENGMSDILTIGIDLDNDGLNDVFETNGVEGAIDPYDVNEDIEDPTDLSILPDTDGDLALGGDVDYRDAIDVYFPSASVDFDGIDDHLSVPGFVTGFPEVTIMGWVMADLLNIGTTNTLFGEDVSCRIILTSSNNVQFSVRTNTSPTIAVSGPLFNYNEWHHVAGTFNGITGEQNLYIDGELVNSAMTGFTGTLELTAFSNGNFEIGRHARNTGDLEYFDGAIDEVRVFNKALSEDQIQQIVYQEIENNVGTLKGTTINKNVEDIITTATIPWANLQAYYPMKDILTSKTTDASSYGRDADLKNIFTVQNQTAPMPYETVADGPWTAEGTWLHGDVWDIEDDVWDISNTKDWSIVQIHDNVTTSVSHANLGLFIDADKTLSVSGDNQIRNTWYVQLDGTLDLADDSQLIQSITSDLVTSAAGKILRRQEGNSNMYWYNYWASPVGSLGATTLSDNNAATNNTNNSAFSLNMLKDGAAASIQFTAANEEVGKISSNWLYQFQNGLTYWDWVAIDQNSAIAPGQGYTQKGTGNAGTEQQYIFEGKPNNGTILVEADDVDLDSGNESQQNVTLTTTLIGNPYPSALDARKFITDNAGIINDTPPAMQGTILLWEQWAGNSHYLAEYEGGYGYINLTATARAYQHPDIPIAGQAQPNGIKTPSYYIPVGQGFFVEVINDGDIEFNNGQRVFIKEADSSATDPTVGSVFFRGNSAQTQRDGEVDPMQLIRLEFATSAGATRRFVLGFSDTTTEGFDYGYDGGLISELPEEDMTSLFNDMPYVIQAFSPMTPDKVIDLNFNASGDYSYSLDIAELKNIDPAQGIFLKDHQENIIWDLRQGPYNFSAFAGQDKDRFDIVFRGETLSNEEHALNDVIIFVNNTEDKLFVKGLTEQVASLTLTNMLGQHIKAFANVSNQSLENGLYVGDLSAGVYLVNLKTQSNNIMTKKVILE